MFVEFASHEEALELAEIFYPAVRVNLTGSFLYCRQAFTAMRTAGEGRIVNIASLSGVYAPRSSRAERVQRLEVRGDRPHRGDRGRGEKPRDQRDLRQP
jgi:NAD(P)-dependent dehydrogenase (short-subunit alcohol dehydrogenase family)